MIIQYFLYGKKYEGNIYIKTDTSSRFGFVSFADEDHQYQLNMYHCNVENCNDEDNQRVEICMDECIHSCSKEYSDFHCDIENRLDEDTNSDSKDYSDIHIDIENCLDQDIYSSYEDYSDIHTMIEDIHKNNKTISYKMYIMYPIFLLLYILFL